MPASGVMVQRLRIGNLAPLWHPGEDSMTFLATHVVVLCVTEADTEGPGELRRPRVAAQLMTGAARRNITPTRLSAWCVTLVAGAVSIESGGNRQRDTSARWSVTGCATDVSLTHVPSVIELHAKAAQAREGLQRAGLHISVTNCAERTVRARELLRVTPGTREMLRSSRPSGHGRVRIAAVTEQAGQARVVLTIVLELRIIETFG
jgi:hypothetical protein